MSAHVHEVCISIPHSFLALQGVVPVLVQIQKGSFKYSEVRVSLKSSKFVVFEVGFPEVLGYIRNIKFLNNGWVTWLIVDSEKYLNLASLHIHLAHFMLRTA